MSSRVLVSRRPTESEEEFRKREAESEAEVRKAEVHLLRLRQLVKEHWGNRE